MVWGGATLLRVADDRFVDLLDALAAVSGWLPPVPTEK